MRLKKIFLFIVLLLPAVSLFIAAVENSLGPDPAEALADATGEWALRVLLLTLTVSPLCQLTGRAQLLQYRRMLGLFAFFYACLHFLAFVAFLLAWQWSDIYTAFIERPYISVGLMSFVLMLPLALSSTNGMRRRLGRKWRTLHKLIYPCALLALLHLWWQVRSDYTEFLVYLVIVILLILARLSSLLLGRKGQGVVKTGL